MQHYRFAMRKNGTQIEELGAMALRDDSEALDFGKKLTQDLARYAKGPAVAVEIVAGDRTVASIPLAE